VLRAGDATSHGSPYRVVCEVLVKKRMIHMDSAFSLATYLLYSLIHCRSATPSFRKSRMKLSGFCFSRMTPAVNRPVVANKSAGKSLLRWMRLETSSTPTIALCLISTASVLGSHPPRLAVYLAPAAARTARR
jgi:hypothetical protein